MDNNKRYRMELYMYEFYLELKTLDDKEGPIIVSNFLYKELNKLMCNGDFIYINNTVNIFIKFNYSINTLISYLNCTKSYNNNLNNRYVVYEHMLSKLEKTYDETIVKKIKQYTEELL